MKKGFTLIELLAVLLLIGTLATIITPIVTNSIIESRDQTHKAQMHQLIKGAKSWAAKNYSDLPDEGESISITLGALIQDGYIESGIKDPATKEEIPNCMFINIKNSKGIFKYEVVEQLPEGCSSDNDVFATNIILKGSSVIEVGLGEEYIDPGYKKKSNSGDTTSQVTTTIQKKIGASYQVVNSIDTSSVSTYKIIYSVTTNGTTNSVSRTVKVLDKTPPVITVNGHTSDFTDYIEPSNSYTIPTATATDNIDGDISNNITVSGNVNPNVLGTYTITYSVVDSSKNKRTLRLTVSVNEFQ